MDSELSHLLSSVARASSSSVIRDLLRLSACGHVLSLAGGLPASELFPVDELRVLANSLLDEATRAARALQYGPTEGSDELRSFVEALYAGFASIETDSVGVAGHVRSGDRSSIITTGSQQGLDLLGRVLLDPGDVVVVEAPTYLGALQAFDAQRPQVVDIPVDADGLDVGYLAALLRKGCRPKLCYIVPNFSNPSGATLALGRRKTLAQLADRYGFVVIEDDPYGALRFTGDPLPPVAQFGELVVTLGSASKVLAPGLRVGWMMAPTWMAGAVVRAKQAADLHTSSLSQALVAAAMAAPWFPAHVERIRQEYAGRAAALCAALDAHQEFELDHRPTGGMFAWVRVASGDRAGVATRVDTTELLASAIANGVAYVPGAAFGASPDRMRLSFVTLAPELLTIGVERLIQTMRQAAVPEAVG